MGAGRPTSYKPEYCQQLIEYFSDFSEPKFFQYFATVVCNVSHATILNWCKEYPEFLEAYSKAHDLQEFNLASGMITNRYNAHATGLTLKNVAGWRDRQELEHSGSVNVEVIDYSQVRDEEEEKSEG